MQDPKHNLVDAFLCSIPSEDMDEHQKMLACLIRYNLWQDAAEAGDEEEAEAQREQLGNLLD